MKDHGWRFDEINSKTIDFCKTTDMNGSKFVKVPLRSSVILQNGHNDKH